MFAQGAYRERHHGQGVSDGGTMTDAVGSLSCGSRGLSGARQPLQTEA